VAEGRIRFKTGASSSTSGEDDFDRSRERAAGRHRTTRTAGSSSPTAAANGPACAVANAAMGLFTNYGEIGQRSGV